MKEPLHHSRHGGRAIYVSLCAAGLTQNSSVPKSPGDRLAGALQLSHRMHWIGG